MPDSYPTVAIIILTWNEHDLTLGCLESVAELDYPASRLRTIVVDNGSTDGTSRHVVDRYPEVTVLQNSENLGYAGGNNVGIRYALAQGLDYVCILNNDTTVAPDFLGPLLAVFDQYADVGIVTPLVADMTDPDRVWALGAAVDQRTGYVPRLHADEDAWAWQTSAPFEVDVASGAAMLVKHEVFERAGFLDEEFYLYYEEPDWCLRARQAGYRIIAAPLSVIWHKVSATLGPTSPVIDYYMARNQLRFIAHHWSSATRVLLLARSVIRTLLAVAAFSVKSHDGQRLPHRNARLLALRDALMGRWGKMGPDVEAVCYPNQL
jgi:hypothetical protein